jgi:proteasome lid subunit RPN8/RPN11
MTGELKSTLKGHVIDEDDYDKCEDEDDVEVQIVAINPDGSTILSWSDDKTLRYVLKPCMC